MWIDPVCGMRCADDSIVLNVGAESYHFCSEGCQTEFLRNTDDYLKDRNESETSEMVSAREC